MGTVANKYIGTVVNRYSMILSQIGDPPLKVFNNLQEAINFYFTPNAQKCHIDHCTRVQYQVVKDENGQSTKLKRTMGFDLSGQGQVHNNKKIELIGKNDWGANPPYGNQEVSDHLF